MEVAKNILGIYDKNCSVELGRYQSVHSTRTNSTIELANSRCHFDLRKKFHS